MIMYAGIGARETPPEILKAMRSIGKYLAISGAMLRSGGARGADSAFEEGADIAKGFKQIYLPYQRFNNNESDFYTVTKEARLLAKKYHPAWEHLGSRGRDFMGRNAYQVLGLTLDRPADFIVCYTFRGHITGGTGQALRMAEDYKIPVCNLGNKNLTEVEAFLKQHIE